MRILFLDQSGKLGGAELCLLDMAKPWRTTCLVALLADGPFRERLEQHQIPVRVLADRAIQVRKDSGLLHGLCHAKALMEPIQQVVALSRDFDLIYANTAKALVVGAVASALTGCPLVYHLHDILSKEHFSFSNRRLLVALANRFAVRVIANSHASRAAFLAAGGHSSKTTVIYNGFDPEPYRRAQADRERIRQELGIGDRCFVVKHFSRLSPWKGQHVLIEALAQCPESVMALLVGDALFGEQEYVQQLHHQVRSLGLEHRVRFLGFRSDVPQLMAASDLVVHTSTAPEPFGRVIVEAMLCGQPVVATASGGAIELVENGKTGWLTPSGDATKLATVINQCFQQPEQVRAIAQQAQLRAQQRFNLTTIHQQIAQILQQVALGASQEAFDLSPSQE